VWRLDTLNPSLIWRSASRPLNPTIRSFLAALDLNLIKYDRANEATGFGVALSVRKRLLNLFSLLLAVLFWSFGDLGKFIWSNPEQPALTSSISGSGNGSNAFFCPKRVSASHRIVGLVCWERKIFKTKKSAVLTSTECFA
jgi:hypothetical protein